MAGVDALEVASAPVSDVRPSPQPVKAPEQGSLEAEESAGGPPMPSIAPPSVTAVATGDEDEVMHEVDGKVLPNGIDHDRLAVGAGAVDAGMPGDSRELGNGPEIDERNPPMSADIDQPTAPNARVDGDVAMSDAAAPHVQPEVSTAVDAPEPAPAQDASASLPPASALPPHLAPATEPGLLNKELSLSTMSNATAPPSPAGEAAAVAAHSLAPADVSAPDAVMSDAASPSASKRPIEEDEAERDVKRQRYDDGSASSITAAPLDGLAPAADIKPSMSPAPDAHSSSFDQPQPAEGYDSQHQSSYTSDTNAFGDSKPFEPTQPDAPASDTLDAPGSPYTSLPPSAFSTAPPEPAISQPIGSSAQQSYGLPADGTPLGTPTGTIDPGALSAPPSAMEPIAPALPPLQTKLPKEHQRFAESVLRNLKKQRESLPFLVPVDPIALNIPQYPNFIKNPMDLGTIEKKLKGKEYRHIDEWISDVRLIWSNCYAFNGQPGPSAPVSISAKVLEESFEKQIGKIPTPAPPKPPKPKALPGYRTGPSAHHNQLRRASGGGRHIRAPQIYEPEYDDAPRKRPNGPQSSQMRYCRDILREVLKKGNESFTHPFMHPVDPIALNIPDYPRIVKKPMDLSTVKRRFDNGEYASPEHFAADMRLICKNCFAYNPVGTAVHEMGRKLEHLFESRMLQMPEPGYDDDEDFYDSYDASGKDPSIVAMERQLAAMQRNLEAMKKGSARPPPAAPKPKAPPRPRPAVDTQRRPAAPKTDYLSDEYQFEEEGTEVVQTPDGPREITFDMKRELATKITNCEGPQLEQAIEIIRSSAPTLLGDESKEIELDIDQLDGATLLKLYNFVVGAVSAPKSPVRRKPEATLTAAGVRAQKSGRAGTGGLKGTHLDESIESAKIAALQQKLDALNNGGSAGSPPAAASPGATTAPAPAGESAAGKAEGYSSSSDGYSSDSDQD